MDKYGKIAKELLDEAESQRAKEVADINLKYDEYHRAVRKVMDRLRVYDQTETALTALDYTNPCIGCDTGWETASGKYGEVESCYDTCEKIRGYLCSTSVTCANDLPYTLTNV